VAQSTHPVGDHIEVAVALYEHQIQAVHEAQYKKGDQKADDKAEKWTVLTDPSG
jgi:hypothetical protein